MELRRSCSNSAAVQKVLPEDSAGDGAGLQSEPGVAALFDEAMLRGGALGAYGSWLSDGDPELSDQRASYPEQSRVRSGTDQLTGGARVDIVGLAGEGEREIRVVPVFRKRLVLHDGQLS